MSDCDQLYFSIYFYLMNKDILNDCQWLYTWEILINFLQWIIK
jgi:hypothetical protein